MRQRIEERYYGTPHTTSGYPLNRKSVSCPRAYRAFLVTYESKILEFCGSGVLAITARQMFIPNMFHS